MRRGFSTAIVMALALGMIRSEAQTWPARQIELIMPWPAGSGVDVIARAIAQAIAQPLTVCSTYDRLSGSPIL